MNLLQEEAPTRLQLDPAEKFLNFFCELTQTEAAIVVRLVYGQPGGKRSFLERQLVRVGIPESDWPAAFDWICARLNRSAKSESALKVVLHFRAIDFKRHLDGRSPRPPAVLADNEAQSTCWHSLFGADASGDPGTRTALAQAHGKRSILAAEAAERACKRERPWMRTHVEYLDALPEQIADSDQCISKLILAALASSEDALLHSLHDPNTPFLDRGQAVAFRSNLLRSLTSKQTQALVFVAHGETSTHMAAICGTSVANAAKLRRVAISKVADAWDAAANDD